jgi:glycosyltransferase involved in cell wall biosynthesis
MVPALHAAGHHVALWHEVDTPSDHPMFAFPETMRMWSVSSLGLRAAVEELRTWQPDLLFAHGLLDPAVERQALDVAPAVFFAHDYYGTCISGSKTLTKPVVTPCNRKFGWQCMAEYYPRRCGGLSPVTMLRQFQRQHDRLQLLSRYAAIVTHSGHMRREYLKHGFAPGRVFNVKYGPAHNELCRPCAGTKENDPTVWRLLFAGRMDRLKGGSELLQALPDVARRVSRPVRLAFAGDGPMRTLWEEQAAAIQRTQPQIQVEFQGWLPSHALEQLYKESDLLVLPSLWPEPLALVGLEAARHKLPTVAFDVGGISEWLRSGTNGVLAPGDPPTSQGLSDAIVAVLQDSATHARYSEGAGSLAKEFSLERHLRLLLEVFEGVVQ